MPMDRKLYPANWEEIRTRVLERDGNKCRFCGVPNYMLITRDPKGNWFESCFIDGKHFTLTGHGKPVRIILTIAHLDHDKGSNEDRLVALCQRCHLRYDSSLHVSNAAATRRIKKENAGQSRFF